MVQAIRGMNDVLPGAVAVWQGLENTLRTQFAAYDYQEVRFPLLEKTELFARSIGADTDIVAKEMYTFADRNGDSLTLRPEGTASCVRLGLQHGLFHNQQQRLWYLGPMFRHERPQRGRYRQFHQAGVEAFGWTGPDIDAELIALSARLWRALGLGGLTLQLNSLGSPQAREDYRSQLQAFLRPRRDRLDPDSQRRLDTNPLRILDSKDPATQALLEEAPCLADHIDPESRQHLAQLCRHLEELAIPFELNPRLVRGLDYYTRTVFEWVTTDLGAQGTVCAGGRYDGLVTHLGGKRAVPAAGFAVGLERLVELLSGSSDSTAASGSDVFVAVLGDAAEATALRIAESLRDAGYRVQQNCGGGGVRSQLKRADKGGARVAVLIGEDEVAAATVTVKLLRENVPQQTVDQRELTTTLARILETN